ncbi:hypothetical protein GCM10023155_03710 [Bremerella cremea]
MESESDATSPQDKPSTSGTLVVAVIIAVAVAVSLVTVWHHWNRGYASIAYWGALNGENIRYAPKVELRHDGQSFDISKVRGLVHFRQALIEDSSFEGTLPTDKAAPNWTHQVDFTPDGAEPATTVWLDLDQGFVGLADSKSVLVPKPNPTASGIRQFVADALAQQASK